MIGSIVEERAADDDPDHAVAAEEDIRFVRWQHPSGLFATEVPAGWRIEGEIGPNLELGQFKIEGYSPDGRSFFTLAHNWLSYMEYFAGPYRPGHATIEEFILPQFLAQQSQYIGARVVYRSPIRQLFVPDPLTGLGIGFDSGNLGFLLQHADGSFAAGMAAAETTHIPSPGTPGLWRLRLGAIAFAPADEGSLRFVRAVLERAYGSLELSDEFFRIWNEAHEATVKTMRDFSRQMERVFDRYLESAGRSSARGDRDPLDGWSEMMRGGGYAEDPTTGEQY